MSADAALELVRNEVEQLVEKDASSWVGNDAYNEAATRLGKESPATVRTGRPPRRASVAVEWAPYTRESRKRSAAACL